MGAAASTIDPSTPISLDRAKELAGDKWNEELEEKFKTSWEEKESLTLSDLKRIAPLLFVDLTDNIPIETVIAVTVAAGTEWNEQLQSIFDANKVEEVIEFAKWKALRKIVLLCH
jgi:hypothetical protein